MGLNIEQQILSLIEDHTGVDNSELTPATDIFRDLGCVGDDFHELIEKYAEQFNVDMSEYLWYFHADEEGSNFIGGAFFNPPYLRVERIPITPALLLKFALLGKWKINYPEYKLPKKRWDLVINQIVIIGLIISWLLYYFLS
jgi:hypothetical protein